MTVMLPFVPKRAFFEPQALDYPLGKKIYNHLTDMGVEIAMTGSHNRVTGIPGKTTGEAFREAKRTLVVGVRKTTDFASCKPSAHYQLPLNTSCPSMCEYCYLATTLGRKPYMRVYVNIEEVLEQAQKYMDERKPEITYFEGAATSDPIPAEYITGVLKQAIEFFGTQQFGRFRFVTKHSHVDSLLDAKHNGHTRFRFSLNADKIITRFEHATPGMEERVQAAGKVARAGYPVGFIIAPIFYYPEWQNDYRQLFAALDRQLPEHVRQDLAFEFITHRYTTRAKNQITEIFPATTLPMDEEHRKFKYGQFGYGKYVYNKDVMTEMKTAMVDMASEFFPDAKTEYFV